MFPEMGENRYIRETPVLVRIGKLLHETVEDMGREPVPERWVELINRLNAEEEAQSERKH
jgi:hypothetical protein